MPNAVAIAGLSKTYADGTHALDTVALDMRAGEIVAIVGGSGCGKTTLLRLLSGLDRASAGTITLDGTPVTGPRPDIAVVFQEPRLFPWLDVAGNVGFGLDRLPKSERAARVSDALARVGLAEHAARFPRDLSGGQQQRVSIARAFVLRPKLLLLDEPFSALDAFTRQDLHADLLRLWAEGRPTIVIVTHDVEEAVTLADTIVVMRPKPGRIFSVLRPGLSRPRDRRSAGFERARAEVLEELDRSMEATRPVRPATDDAGALWW
jgi:sulfonate transport system ATP-binding protein